MFVSNTHWFNRGFCVRRISTEKPTQLVQPYFSPGASDFASLRRANQFYVDSTRFIPVLESLGRTLFFLRPPRWGKSLLQTTLESYYDVAVPKTKFDSLFSGLEISQNPTTGASQYFILKWDFSVDVDVSNSEGIRQALYDKINNTVTAFAIKYGFPLVGDVDEIERTDSIEGRKDKQPAIRITRGNALASFQSLVMAVRATSTPLYLIIDEYDRFANKLLFENPTLYGSVVMGESGKRGSSVLRSIFEAVKEASGNFSGGMFRCLVVGLAPLALNDASGANSFTDVTYESSLGELLGFTREHLGIGLDFLIKEKRLDSRHKSSLLDLMEEEYNGYQFIPTQSNKLFNPTLSLHFLRKLAINPTYAETVLDLRGKEARRAELVSFLEDPNTKISENIFDLFTINKYSGMSIIQACITNLEPLSVKLTAGPTQLSPPVIQQKMGIRELTQDFKEKSDHFLLSFMHYYGIVTWSDKEGHLRIPNKLVKDQFFERLRTLTKAYYADLSSFIFDDDIDSLQRALREFTDSLHLSPIDDDGTEPSLKVRVIALLSNFPKIGDDYAVDSEHKIYEDSTFKKIDIYMESKGDLTSRVIELKSVPIHWLEPSHWKKGSKRFTLKMKQEVVEKIAKMSPQELSCLPLNLVIQGSWDQKFATVGEYIQAGASQTRNYLDIMETNEGERPLGYLIWAVGVEAIHIEQIS